MRESNENIVGLHAARGCQGTAQASEGIYESFTDIILVQRAEIPQMLICHRYPREDEHYKTPFVGRKMRRGNENIVGLHAARGCRGAVQASRVCIKRLPTVYVCRELEKHKCWAVIADPGTINTTLLRSSAGNCVRATKILLVYTPREGAVTLYKHSKVCIKRFPKRCWCRELRNTNIGRPSLPTLNSTLRNSVRRPENA